MKAAQQSFLIRSWPEDGDTKERTKMRVAKIKLLPVILAAVLVSGVLAGCSSGSSGGQGGLHW